MSTKAPPEDRSLNLPLDQLGDNELLALYVERGSERAFEVLVARHSQMVLSICLAGVANRHCAEDAFQATFLALVRNARRLRSATSLAGWLCRVAQRAAMKASIMNRRKREVAEPLELEINIDPLHQIAAREVVDTLAAELDKVHKPYQESLVLFYFEGLSRQQIADRLGCSLQSVKANLHRGKRQLRMQLMRKGMVPAMAILAVQGIARSAEAAVLPALADKTVAACTAYATAPASVPGNLIALSKSATWMSSSFGSVAGKATFVALAIVVAIGSFVAVENRVRANSKTHVVTVDWPANQSDQERRAIVAVTENEKESERISIQKQLIEAVKVLNANSARSEPEETLIVMDGDALIEFHKYAVTRDGHKTVTNNELAKSIEGGRSTRQLVVPREDGAVHYLAIPPNQSQE